MKRGGLCADLDNLLIVKSQIKYLPAVKAVFKLINFSIFEFNEMIYRRRSNIFQFLFLRFRVIFVLYSRFKNMLQLYSPPTLPTLQHSPHYPHSLHSPHFPRSPHSTHSQHSPYSQHSPLGSPQYPPTLLLAIH